MEFIGNDLDFIDFILWEAFFDGLHLFSEEGAVLFFLPRLRLQRQEHFMRVIKKERFNEGLIIMRADFTAQEIQGFRKF